MRREWELEDLIECWTLDAAELNRMGRAARCPLWGGSFSARPSAEPRGHLSMYEALR